MVGRGAGPQAKELGPHGTEAQAHDPAISDLMIHFHSGDPKRSQALHTTMSITATFRTLKHGTTPISGKRKLAK